MRLTVAPIVPSAPVVTPAGKQSLLAKNAAERVCQKAVRIPAMKTLSPAALRTTLGGIGLALLALCSTGCQGVYNGQTLPSPWYIYDDIQYFAPGPEFKLSREAAAMKAYRADLEAQQAGQ
jgi:hypothetical protein